MAKRRCAKKSGSGRWLWVALAPLLALSAAMALLVLDRETGLPALWHLEDRVERSETRIVELEGEREHLLREVRRLRSDPLAIESVARGQLGMARKNELVVRFEGDDAPPD